MSIRVVFARDSAGSNSRLWSDDGVLASNSSGQDLREAPLAVACNWPFVFLHVQRFAVTALPLQLQTLPCVPEFAELNTQPLAMSWRAYHQARREFDISD